MHITPTDGFLGGGLAGLAGTTLADTLGQTGGVASQDDAISQIMPPIANFATQSAVAGPAVGGLSTLFGGGLQAIVNQIAQLLQQLAAQLTGNSSSSAAQGDGEQYFQNANASSTGDPHLAFNGTKWDSMTSHDDLLDSDSFDGGYQISTQTTQPNANGVTYNQSATVQTEGGDLSVSFDKDGNATFTEDGRTRSISNGQTIHEDGETISRAQNGVLTISDDNGQGGLITTTLSDNGQGVDVNLQGTNIDLGGDFVNGPNGN